MENNRYKNIILQVVGQAIAAVLSLYISSFVVENVGEAVFGFVGLANNFVSYAALVTVALNSIASRFIAVEVYRNNAKSAGEFYSTTFLTNLIISFAVIIVGGLFIWNMDRVLNVPQGYLGDIQILWLMIFAGFVLDLLSTAFKSATFVTNRIYLNALATVIGVIVRAAVILGMFAVFSDKIWFVGLGTLVSMLLQLVIHFTFSKKLTPQLRIDIRGFSVSKLGILLKSGIWNTISQLGKLLSEGLDLLISNIFISDVSMGILSISKTLPTYVQLLNSTISITTIPQSTYHYSRNELDKFHNQLYSDMNLLSFTACLMTTVLYTFGESFYMLWMPSQNAGELMILTILGSCWNVTHCVIASVYNGLTACNRLKEYSLMTIIFGVVSTVVLLVVLNTTDGGIYAVAGISSVVYIVQDVVFAVPYAKKILGIKCRILYTKIVRNFVAVATLVLVSRTVLMNIRMDTWFRLITAGIIGTAFFALILVLVCYPINQIKAGVVTVWKRLNTDNNK